MLYFLKTKEHFGTYKEEEYFSIQEKDAWSVLEKEINLLIKENIYNNFEFKMDYNWFNATGEFRIVDIEITINYSK